jgi:hypothetical protein
VAFRPHLAMGLPFSRRGLRLSHPEEMPEPCQALKARGPYGMLAEFTSYMRLDHLVCREERPIRGKSSLARATLARETVVVVIGCDATRK